MCNFYLYLTLETVFQALKLTQTCYINMSLFLLKIGNLIINWSSYPTHRPCLKD